MRHARHHATWSRTLAALASLALLAGSARAAPSTLTPDPSTPHGAVGEDLQPGSNSFTEAQVRDRFGKMGFGEVHDLRKDEQGIWHGKASHAGHELSIRMDYRGNVAAE